MHFITNSGKLKTRWWKAEEGPGKGAFEASFGAPHSGGRGVLRRASGKSTDEGVREEDAEPTQAACRCLGAACGQRSFSSGSSGTGLCPCLPYCDGHCSGLLCSSLCHLRGHLAGRLPQACSTPAHCQAPGPLGSAASCSSPAFLSPQP